ncbi:hypothetical protein O181_118477 [Austropuccinia psidii MF-1]|uniref:Uncharacterized protein n=1 Tax=Austropuccinia psidii MF-1 TaxID=1389203 RepID=A0A9Q3KFE6_9BASI|nr:hypothetical protein [Austropuccinia psidii MF-1]
MRPQRVIHRQISHTWKEFYCKSSDRLFSWLGGQLDCRCSPACVWKPEANQCGFASASSTLEKSRPMIAWGSPTTGHFLHIRMCPAQAVGPGLQPKIPLGGWPLSPEGECICGSRLTVGAPFDHPTHSPLETPVGISQQKTSGKTKVMFGGMPPNISHPPTQNIPTVRLPFETANIAQ